MRFINVISCFFLLCASTYASELVPMDEDDMIGLHKGLDGPFLGRDFMHCSPVVGVLDTAVSGMRLHGHWGPVDRGLPRPVTDSIDHSVFPQDATAALLEHIGPCSIALVVNSIASSPVNRYFKPTNIAHIFNAVSAPDFYADPEMSCVKLANALKENSFANRLQWIEAEKEYRANLALGKAYKPTKSKKEKADIIMMSTLLFRAFQDNHGQGAVANGYPQHVVEMILLMFMWKKNPKTALKAFYATLNDTIIDKDKVKDIIWDGPDSKYTLADYNAAKEAQGDLSREVLVFLKAGYDYFESRYPPVVPFGHSYYKIGNVVKPFSNCGEISLLNALMHMLYDFETKEFDVTPLEELKEERYEILDEFIDFFKVICKRPSWIKRPEVMQKWTDLVSGLNTRVPGSVMPSWAGWHYGYNERVPGRKINYIFPEPKDGSTGLNEGGVCALNVRIDNMFVLIGKLMGPPKWESRVRDLTDSLNYKDDFRVINCQLDSFCSWFSRGWVGWTWRVLKAPGRVLKDYKDLSSKEKINKWTDLVLVFSNFGVDVFEWHFQDRHFDFNRVSTSKHALSVKQKLTLRPGDSEPDAYEPLPLPALADFASYFYEDELDSIQGKYLAISKILAHKRKAPRVEVKQAFVFDDFLARWLEPTGKYFVEWADVSVNKKLAAMLIHYMDVDEFLEMNIPKLNSALAYHLAEKNEVVLLNELLNKDYKRFVGEGRSYHSNNYAKMLRILDETLQHGKLSALQAILTAGADQYALRVSSGTFMHLAAYAGSAELKSLNQWFSFCDKTRDGYTPLHYAAQRVGVKIDATRVLLARGAPVNEQNEDGDTPLHLASKTESSKYVVKHLVQSGADISIRNNAGQTAFDCAFETVPLMPSAFGKIKVLIKAGAPLNQVYKNGLSYLQWAQKNAYPKKFIRYLINYGAVEHPVAVEAPEEVISGNEEPSYWTRNQAIEFMSLFVHKQERLRLKPLPGLPKCGSKYERGFRQFESIEAQQTFFSILLRRMNPKEFPTILGKFANSFINLVGEAFKEGYVDHEMQDELLSFLVGGLHYEGYGSENFSSMHRPLLERIYPRLTNPVSKIACVRYSYFRDGDNYALVLACIKDSTVPFVQKLKCIQHLHLKAGDALESEMVPLMPRFILQCGSSREFYALSCGVPNKLFLRTITNLFDADEISPQQKEKLAELALSELGVPDREEFAAKVYAHSSLENRKKIARSYLSVICLHSSESDRALPAWTAIYKAIAADKSLHYVTRNAAVDRLPLYVRDERKLDYLEEQLATLVTDDDLYLLARYAFSHGRWYSKGYMKRLKECLTEGQIDQFLQYLSNVYDEMGCTGCLTYQWVTETLKP